MTLRAQQLLGLIRDAYRRMASNKDPKYRQAQMARCEMWLEELAQLYTLDPSSVMEGQ